MSGEYLTGWEGIAWEAEERCVYCDHRVSEPTGPRNREAKAAHRETCPAEPVVPRKPRDWGKP